MKNVLLVLVIVGSLVLSFAARNLKAEDSAFQAGAAVVDISPQQLPAIMNGGFTQRIVDQIADPLHSRALVLRDGHETIAIVIVDSCMIPTIVCDEVKRIASQQTGIPKDRILISATHTHTAPSVMEMCLGTGVDQAYLKYLPAKIAQSISKAHGKLQPAKFGATIVDGSEFTNCRRWITRSDRMGTDPFGGKTVRAMMHPGYQNPNYTSPAGPIDPWLSVFSVVAARDDSPICVMANLSMHYFGGGNFSADYFGDVARILESRLGKRDDPQRSAFVGIMSQGTSGDLHWMDYSEPRRGLSRQQYASNVANRILDAHRTIKHRADITLAMAEKRLVIDRRTPSRERREWARPINAARLNRPPRNRTEVYAQQAEWIHENPKAEVVLQAVRIGDLGITAIPNEVYGITGLKLKLQSPLQKTFNLELANGAAGYIPPPEQHRLGGYTTWPARTAGLVSEAEPLIVETLLTLLESVADKKRQPLAMAESEYSSAVKELKPIAYWRLDDITSDRVTDVVGNHHATFKGGVALFLRGADSDKMDGGAYGNRSVYLAGGFIEAKLDGLTQDYSVSFWLNNALPVDARELTGVLFSNGSDKLSISGREFHTSAGQLKLADGDKAERGYIGCSLEMLRANAWHHITIVRRKDNVIVHLDGKRNPIVGVTTKPPKSVRHLRIGSGFSDENRFDGKVDEIAVFDRALNIDEVSQLYTRSGMKPPKQPKRHALLSPKPTDDTSRKKYADAVLKSKPIAYWRLHDESIKSVANSAGDRPATYELGALPLSRNPLRRNFSGGRMKTQIAGLKNTYSVEFWFRNELHSHSRPVTAYLFSRAVDGVHGADGDNLGIGGTHSSMGKLIVFNGNSRNALVAGETTVARGSWAHVVMARVNNRITVYLNGDREPEIDADLPIGYPAKCSDFLFGGRADNFANLHGMLEEVAVYDRVLTGQEAEAHFQAAEVKFAIPKFASEPNRTFAKPESDQLNSNQSTSPKPTSNKERDAPKPTDASKAIDTIHVRKGFKVQLVAAEPLVQDPVAIDWGPDGKLWVIEMADYPLGIDGNGTPGGRVRFLEDTNGDSEYDKSTLFAEGLSFPTGVLVWGRGVLITAAPQIVYLEDSSGDGKADVRQILYSGFLEGNQQLRVNGLRWGLDNWVYCASGSHHGGYGKDSQISALLTNTKHPIGSRDFRIRPDTGEIDPQSGPSQYGRNRDDWGNWFGVQNSHPLWHYVLADHHIRRNPHFAPPNPKHQVVTPSNPSVYPISKLQKRYHSFSQSGRFTSACSAMIYRDNYLFEVGDEQHAFTCEPFHNLVQHNLIAADGVSFKFRRDPAESKVDFFASQDRWCRPVMARTGPDGGLWIVDMYRYMIEHPQWLPQNGKDELRPWFRSGEDKGRIYRIVRADQPPRKIPRLEDQTPQQLLTMLESPNGWTRDTAQRLIVRNKSLPQRTQVTTIRQLEQMATSSQQPLARLHALCTLDGLQALASETLESALQDNHAGVRRNAVRLAADTKVDIQHLASLVQDRAANVRLELATTLGSYNSPQASRLLAELIVKSHDDSYIAAAAMSSLHPGNVSDVLVSALRFQELAGNRIISDLVGQAVAMSGTETIDAIVDIVSSTELEQPPEARFETLARTLDALAIRKLETSALSVSSRDNISRITEQARIVTADRKLNTQTRAAAIQLLNRDPNHVESDLKLLESLLVPQSPVVLQQAIVRHLARNADPDNARILLAGWRSHSPALRQQILDTITSRKAWITTLREHLENGRIQAGEINASTQQRVLNITSELPQWQKALALKASNKRADVLKRFQPALLLVGNSAAGERIFRKTCIQCHKLQNAGHEVGPKLASITNKTKEALFSSILDPNAAVDAKYFSYNVITGDGRIFNGRLETETASSITLLAAEGKRTTILRRDIEELLASQQSVMPEGLEKELTPQDLANLIQFVQEAFR